MERGGERREMDCSRLGKTSWKNKIEDQIRGREEVREREREVCQRETIYSIVKRRGIQNCKCLEKGGEVREIEID